MSDVALLHILVVDDEPLVRTTLTRMLARKDCQVESVASAEEACGWVGRTPFDLVFLDYMMPQEDGLSCLRRLRALRSDLRVVFMTAHSSAATAVEAMREGAIDYVEKPFSTPILAKVVEQARQHKALLSENQRLRRELQQKYRFESIVGVSPAMQGMFKSMQAAARSEATVLIQGESGTGKELVARAIHAQSLRADRAFVPLDCSTINPNLIEAELFGHTRGAFTGADVARPGMFQAADGGTLFLDELSEIVFEIQAKLLRAIQERTVKPVGASASRKVNVRIIGATNKDLREQITRGEFREDLFYRLNVIPIAVPPLRERREDIPALVRCFIERYRSPERPVEGASPECLARLQAHAWPGNVRELENVIERAIVLGADTQIQAADLPPQVATGGAPARPGAGDNGHRRPLALADLEWEAIQDALRYTGGDKEVAAKLLGINRSTLYRKLKRQGS